MSWIIAIGVPGRDEKNVLFIFHGTEPVYLKFGEQRASERLIDVDDNFHQKQRSVVVYLFELRS